VIPVGSPVQLKFNVPYALGSAAALGDPGAGPAVGPAACSPCGWTPSLFLGMGMSATLKDDASLWSASAEYAFSTLTLTSEYTRSRSNQVSVLPGNTFDITADGGYVMLTWLATRWLQPGAYYSLYFPDISNRHGPRAAANKMPR